MAVAAAIAEAAAATESAAPGGNPNLLGLAVGSNPRVRKHVPTAESNPEAWLAAAAMEKCPAVRIEGVEGQFSTWTDGSYLIQPEESTDELPMGPAPCYERQGGDESYQRWLYWGRDGRWRVGGGDAKDRRKNGAGSLRSAVCGAGVLPTQATGWEVRTGYSDWQEQEGLKVIAMPPPS
eukprot:CAMPEP_0197891584 /NCGR_PEP_ID=MMETSP1439-20131203/28991_1 /TAXON_ID=66791 /ORGANISM="Gonyaulax spinifera, Strain CCMP409" /LENGTH=178 /DNA_ID=CAMNT_0043511693 /DNA_START=21 /DNA_END=557 /DNA_ORIENTATION=+